jgi:tetratricopeptide (TPR) repeat protein
MTAEHLSRELESALIRRDIKHGLSLLRSHQQFIWQLTSRRKDAGVLLGCVAKWIDMDFSLLDHFEQLLARQFQKHRRSLLVFRDVAYIRFADGVVSMHRGEVDVALHELNTSFCDATDLGDRDLQITGNYFIARCLRLQGRYSEGEVFAHRAARLAEGGGNFRKKQLAVIGILLAWLQFQRGESKSAEDLLKSSTKTLSDTSDYVSKGNTYVLSARMRRRLGSAHIEEFGAAIREYEKGGAAGRSHPNLARALADRALANILRAHSHGGELEEKLAEHATNVGTKTKAADISALKREIDKLHKKASKDLTRAEGICVPLHMDRILATCCLRRAFIQLERSDTKEARKKVKKAYKLASAHGDYIAMGRAKVLECMIEDQDYLYRLGDPDRHAEEAYKCASEAVELADKTENTGLQARAWLAMAFVLVNSKRDRHRALELLKRAEGIYNSGGFSFLREHIEALRARIENRSAFARELETWIHSPERKSFDQIKNLVYSLVWEHVGRKIGRVAKNLTVTHDAARANLLRAGRMRRSAHRSKKKRRAKR